jgi:uncharacterized membrane protein
MLAAIITSYWLSAEHAILIGWDSAALVYALSVLAVVLRFDSETTRTHALRENPGRGAVDLLLLVTSVASVGAVAVLIFQANHATGAAKIRDILMGLSTVVVSWVVVHTLFMLRYARQYYDHTEGGIDFNNRGNHDNRSGPSYIDFAYLAFTIGMCFQVSDTAISSREIRATVLRHALLAYMFGTVILTTAINTVVTLSSS